MASSKRLKTQFEIYNVNHPYVYEHFKQVCQTLIDKGIEHATSTLVIEVVKYRHIMMTGKPLSVPNNHRAYYAALWQSEHKKPWRFFKLKPSRPNRRDKLTEIAESPDVGIGELLGIGHHDQEN